MEPLIHLCPKIDRIVEFPSLFGKVLKSRQITGITLHRAGLAEK